MTTYTLTRDLLAAGNSRSDLAAMLRRDDLIQLRRGAYREPGDVDLEVRHRMLVESTMAMGDGNSVISFGSAAVMHELPVFPPSVAKVHLTRRRTAGGRRGSVVHQHVALLEDADVCTIDELPVTTLARTFVDLARTVPIAQSVAAGDRALRLGMTGSAVDDQLESARLRHGIARARRAAGLLDPLSESAGESVSRVAIRDAGLPTPELQVELRDERGQFVARPDFLWRRYGVVGEFDGMVKYHKLLRPGETAADVVLREKAREERLSELGLIVIRWLWSDLYEPKLLADRIRRALRRGTPYLG